MRNENLLVEIGTEELPPKALKKLATALATNTEQQLKAADLSFQQVKWYAAPRRLAVYVSDLADKQADKLVEKRGPAVSAAFDKDGEPTKAAQGWARGNGITLDQAERLKTDKGEWLLYRQHVAGKTIDTLLGDIMAKALAGLPIPKPMRWGEHTTQFIRPVHTLTALYGGEVIHCQVLGLNSARTIQGHRFHGEATFELDHADNYLSALEQHYVVADFAARKARVLADVEATASELNATADINDDLLDEIAALVEWPVVLTASFEQRFLDVPKEALIYTMKDDQKYIPLLDSEGKLMSTFVFVSNIESKDPIQVTKGNEKVIRPRLADAEFFFQTDKKQTLESRLGSLESVLFQQKLGTLKDKSDRIAFLAAKVATLLGQDDTLAYRAGLLSKTDLMTNMVMEFPDVQGVMGMHYATHDGEPAEVALALNEQYMPRFAGDKLPSSMVSCAVALADKMDTLVGIFGIGQLPKGDKDPFALRRAAIGILRITVEKGLDLDLCDLVDTSLQLYGDKISNADTREQVIDFILTRFKTWYQDQGVDADVVQAVAVRRPTRPADFAARVEAVAAFKQLDSALALAAANKRVANILAKSDAASDYSLDKALLLEDQEKALANALDEVKDQIEPALARKDYTQILSTLAGLREVIDAFFDNVMVNADDVALKNNRLALLSDLRAVFLITADVSLLSQ